MDEHLFGGIWTQIKLDVLKQYLSAFTTALRRKNLRLIYLDGFAGTGRCVVKTEAEPAKVEGSARIALQTFPPFDHFCFIEQSQKKAAALLALKDEYQGQSIDVVAEDANSALQDLVRRYDWRNTRAVLFLDPFGLDVEWHTLQVVAQTRAIDVWYLFPYSGLYRQAAKSSLKLTSEGEAAITRCLGTAEWREEFYIPQRQQDIFGQESETRAADHRQMLKYVSARLRTVFPAVSDPKILYQSQKSGFPSGSPLFALYFAVSNPNQKAVGLAMKIAGHILRES